MTNHIQQILNDLDNPADTAKSARFERLKIRAICALAQEVRHISNQMAWGASDDIPARVPAEAGEMARELDQALSEVSAEMHDCKDWTRRNHSDMACNGCAHIEGCNDKIPF